MIVIRKGGLRMGTLLLMTIQIVFMAYTILWNVVRLIKTRECRKRVTRCQNRKCRWRHSCGSYDGRKEMLLVRAKHLYDMQKYM